MRSLSGRCLLNSLLLAANNGELWVKTLADGQAIALLNQGETEHQFALPAERLGPRKPSKLRNVGRGQEVGRLSLHAPRHFSASNYWGG